LPGETIILENGNLVIPSSTDDNSQPPHQPQSLTAPLPTPPLSTASLPAQPLLKSLNNVGEKMRNQTVKDLLSAQDTSTGGHHVEATQVPISSNLKVALMEHQKTGYNWMCQKEDSELKGGLLADDMGLGKVIGKDKSCYYSLYLPFLQTIQSLALITGRPCTGAPPITPPYIPETIPPVKSKATLILCPISLVSQWAQEIEAKTENLAVYKHQGPNRLTNPYAIASYDGKR
jgi:SNF2 family DNA or RNA helicase